MSFLFAFLSLLPILWILPGFDEYFARLREKSFWPFLLLISISSLAPAVYFLIDSQSGEETAASLILLLIFAWNFYFGLKKNSEFLNLFGIYCIMPIFVFSASLIGLRNTVNIFSYSFDLGTLALIQGSCVLYYNFRRAGIGRYIVYKSNLDFLSLILCLFGFNFLVAEILDLISSGDGMIFVHETIKRNDGEFYAMVFLYDAIFLVIFFKNIIYAPLERLLQTFPEPLRIVFFGLLFSIGMSIFRLKFELTTSFYFFTMGMVLAPVFVIIRTRIVIYFVYIFIALFGYLIFGIKF